MIKMKTLPLVLGIVTIAIGLPLLTATLYSIFFRNPEQSIEDAKDHPFEAITTSFRIGVFMKGVADLQGSKNEAKPTWLLLGISLGLCIAGYFLLKM